MTDTQPPRPTLKLSIKPATLESLANRITKQTVVIPPKEVIAKVASNKGAGIIPTSQPTPQAKVVAPTLKQQSPKVEKQPKPQQSKTQQAEAEPKVNESIPKEKKKVKEKTPPPVLQPYDFFEVYNKLHRKFRTVISLKTPAALAIGINKSIREVSGLSKKNNDLWMAEYLRRSLYYKRGHLAGASRYNLQGEIVGTVSQEQIDARLEMVKNFKKRQKKVE